MPHSAREIAVRRTDAANRRVQTSKRIRWPAETCGATGVTHFGAGVDEYLFERFAANRLGLKSTGNLGRRRNDERVDLHFLAAKNFGRGAEVRQLAASTRADVSTVELRSLDL